MAEFLWPVKGSGTGSVVGPTTSTDNAVPRFDGTTGTALKNSPVTIDDAGDITVPALATVDGRDVSVDGANLDGHIASTVAHGATGAVVGTTNTQTLTNKTLISPVINTPTGIVKGDVGLSNVDNTSDAAKNAAVATLTNKTLTSPVINTPTGIVKGDVGLGNVDNTSDATKNSAAGTLTNKTLSTGSKITTAVNEVDTTDNTKQLATDLSTAATATTTTLKVSQTVNRTVTLPDATDTLVGKATTDTLTNKSISGATNTLSAVPITALSTFTSSQLATQLTDETGTGAAVFANSPTLVTPALGTPSALVLTNATGLPIAGGGTGQTTKSAAYDALSPATTKGDIEVFSTTNTRLAVGADTFVLTADSSQAQGVKWAAPVGGLAPAATAASVSPAVTNTMYEVDVTSGSVTLTLPGGTTAAVVGALDATGLVSSTKKIIFAPATGQSIDSYATNDTASLQYPNSQAVLYRAAGSTVWKGQYQAATLPSAATATVSGTVSAEINGSFTASLTGPFTSSVTIYYSKVGKSVTLTLPTITATSSAAVPISVDLTNMPSSIRPVVSNDFLVVRAIDNSADTGPGFMRHGPTGAATIYRSVTANAFTATGSAGWEGFSVSYVSA